MIFGISGGNGCGSTTFSYFVYNYFLEKGYDVYIFNNGNYIRHLSKKLSYNLIDFLNLLKKNPNLERKIDFIIINKIKSLKRDIIIWEGELVPYFLKKYFNNYITFWIGCGIKTSSRRISKREGKIIETREVLKRYLNDRLRFYKLYKIKFPGDIKKVCDFSLNTSYIKNLDSFKKITYNLLDSIEIKI